MFLRTRIPFRRIPTLFVRSFDTMAPRKRQRKSEYFSNDTQKENKNEEYAFCICPLVNRKKSKTKEDESPKQIEVTIPDHFEKEYKVM